VLYRSALFFRAETLRPILLILAALTGCDGTLQFSGTGGAAGQTNDASVGGDAPDVTPQEDAPSDMSTPSDMTTSPDMANPPDVAPPFDATTEDRGGGFAPPCHKDTDCPVNKLHCDVATNQCVECLGDSNCMVAPYAHCDTVVHRCVECLSAGDCAPGAICDPTIRICIARCTDGGGCPAAQPFCDTQRSLCVECRNGADCFRPDLCDPTIGRCAFCDSDQTCVAPNVRCDPYNPGRSRCKECLVPADCPASAPYCDVHGGICVTG
jgi:hypothetical protein